MINVDTGHIKNRRGLAKQIRNVVVVAELDSGLIPQWSLRQTNKIYVGRTDGGTNSRQELQQAECQAGSYFSLHGYHSIPDNKAASKPGYDSKSASCWIHDTCLFRFEAGHK
jgi:hypothetical protein